MGFIGKVIRHTVQQLQETPATERKSPGRVVRNAHIVTEPVRHRPIRITEHAQCRGQERLGVGKEKLIRLVHEAYALGERMPTLQCGDPSDLSGLLTSKQIDIRIKVQYQGICFVFRYYTEEAVLVTVYKMT